jgi:hypothetical protein
MFGSSSPTRGWIHSASATTVLGALTLLPLLAAAGCGQDPVDLTPTLGVIELTVLAEGPGPVPDSFDVVFNGTRSGSVAQDGIFTISSLPRGSYQVALLEEEEDCWYGVNARMVTVVPNDTSFTTFLVRCR